MNVNTISITPVGSTGSPNRDADNEARQTTEIAKLRMFMEADRRQINSYGLLEQHWKVQRRELLSKVDAWRGKCETAQSKYAAEQAENKNLRRALIEREAKLKGSPLTKDEEAELMKETLGD